MAATQLKGTQLQNLTITNAQISTSAGITYAKLNLSNSIVNADIATGAAITYSKLNLTNSIVAGDLTAGAISGVLASKFQLYKNQVDNFAAAGFTDAAETAVNASATTDTETTSLSVLGVYTGVNSFGKCAIRDADTNDAINDGSGNEVYGRLSGTSLNAPTNVTGVTILWASSGVTSGDLEYTDATTELVWDGGTAVDVGTNGTYIIYDSTGIQFIIVTVVAASLPGSDQTDSLTATPGGNFNLAYFSEVAEVETPHSITSTDIDFQFSELFDLSNAPATATLNGLANFTDLAGGATSATSVSFDPTGLDNTSAVNVQDAIEDLDTAIGLRAYTENNVVADSEALAASVEKLDLAFGDLYSITLGSEGVREVGDRAANYINFTPGANTLFATLAAIDSALGGSLNATYAEEERSGSTSSTWILSNTPDTALGNLHVFLNGMKLYPGAGNDFTISGATITFIVTIDTADRVVADYAY